MSAINWIVRILGRDASWRIGRALYMSARGEGPNGMETNGEKALIEGVAALAGRSAGAAAPVILDCGANKGEWTALARSAFGNAGIAASFHMFEPSPRTRELITQRFAAHADVTIHPVALSDSEGEAQFHLVSATGGTNSLVMTDQAPEETITVRTARGADFCTSLGIEAIDLLKIDTEGHDYAVIEGFSAMLERQAINVIQFEYNHRWLLSGRSLRSIFDLAGRYGYQVGRTDVAGLEVYADWNPELDRFFEWNYVLLAPGMATKLGARAVRWSIANTVESAS